MHVRRSAVAAEPETDRRCKAYPVLRTDDATTAYAQARGLCALPEREDGGLTAELRTAREVRRRAGVLPGVTFRYVDHAPIR